MPRVDELMAEVATLKAELQRERVAAAFANSNFARENLRVPADIAAARFGARFVEQDGKLVGIDNNGDVIMSRARMGEPALFDEALETIVAAYENKGAILQSGPASEGRLRVVTRAEYDHTPENERAALVKGARFID